MGFNPYQYYFEEKEPDWDKILKSHDDSIYSIIILNNATGYTADQIKYFDYDKLLANFENPLDLRKINYYQYPLFGFLFTKTSRDYFAELNAILKSDLKEYIYLD